MYMYLYLCICIYTYLQALCRFLCTTCVQEMVYKLFLCTYGRLPFKMFPKALVAKVWTIWMLFNIVVCFRTAMKSFFTRCFVRISMTVCLLFTPQLSGKLVRIGEKSSESLGNLWRTRGVYVQCTFFSIVVIVQVMPA